MTIINGAAYVRQTTGAKTTLDQGWSFRRVGDDRWLAAQVPGSNFTDLLRHGLIESPYDSDNELSLQWIEKEDWEYRCLFPVSEADLEADEVELVFDGLDTLCAVSLNDAPLLFSENMFCAHRARCRSLLRVGTNELRLLFKSPVVSGSRRRAKEGFVYPAENDKTGDAASAYVRKAPYHFGWDWGPKYVTSGVWRPVHLDVVHGARIRDVSHRIVALSEDRATIAFELEVEGFRDGPAVLELLCENEDVAPVRLATELRSGVQLVTVSAQIDRPRLWWPNGLGEAYLYRFGFSLLGEHGDPIDTAPMTIGLRTIEVVNQPDKDGECFFVRVNGRPVFMKGVNHIPLDSFQEAATPERYRRLFRDIADANMNMVRVWGGGIYEHDLFYELADEHGILVWQDFMFSCSLYPSDEHFLALVAEEATQAVRRLRNHACLALWCGNNEVSLGIAHWEWPEKFGYSPALFASLVAGNAKLFDELLPSIVAASDPGRFYLPSSPIGFWNDESDDGRGDGHYWGVWHGELPFSTYEERVTRFMSEYGFQSYPLLSSIERFTAPADRVIGSPVLSTHQKHARGDAIIGRFIRETYGEPASFEHFCYLSQVLQADGLRVAFEAHRRAMPYCMGSLYWQLGDCWPSISWSSIDYYGQWKALHYKAARSFAPVLLSIEARDGSYRIHGVSDLVEPLSGTLVLELIAFDGALLWRREQPVALAPNSAQVLEAVNIADLGDVSAAVLRVSIVAAGDIAASNQHVIDLAMLPEPDLVVEAVDDRSVRVSARRFARAVHVSAEATDDDPAALNFSDNFFDLLAGETRTIVARDNRRFDPTTLRVMSVHEARLASMDGVADGKADGQPLLSEA